MSVVVRSSGPRSAIHAADQISILCVAVLAALPIRAEAEGLGSVVDAVASVPRAIFGGILGGGKPRSHRDHARHATPERSVARGAERSVVRAAPAIPAEPKPADHGTAAFWASAYGDAFGYVLAPAGHDDAFWARGYADVIDAMFAPSAAEAAGSKRGQSDPAFDADKSGGFAAAPACAEPQNVDAAIERRCSPPRRNARRSTNSGSPSERRPSA